MKNVFLPLAGFTLWPALVFAQTTGASRTSQPSVENCTPVENCAPHSFLAKCLPAGISLSDVVDVTMAGNANGRPTGPQKITVKQKLEDLKATCNSENKLVDGNGRRIVFYHLIGCWGYPPPNYQELLKKQRGELERLKLQSTVIEMTCNPSGAHISSATKRSGADANRVLIAASWHWSSQPR